MQLSDKSIIKLCQLEYPPLIEPFVDHKVVHECGFSYGLSACSYDFRIAETVHLPPNPIYALANVLKRTGGDDAYVQREWINTLRSYPCQSQLAYTMEKVNIPDNVVGYVVDKSSYARRFVSALNTLFDAGFQGHAVLELVNLSDKPVVIRAGEPICQMVFHWLDQPALNPYRGKYMGQTPGAHGARYEKPDGTWSE